MSKHIRLDRILLETLEDNFDNLDYRETCKMLMEECKMLMEDLDETQDAVDALLETCHLDKGKRYKRYSDNY